MTDAIHDPAAVIPRHAERAEVGHIGSVQTLTGLTLHIKVNGGAVYLGGYVLNREQAETFAQLFVRAVWEIIDE